MKFLLIVVIVGFILFKLINVFFRVLIGGSATNRGGQRQQYQQQYQSRKTADGNVNIDYVPNENGAQKSKNFTGGEDVDYEEVN